VWFLTKIPPFSKAARIEDRLTPAESSSGKVLSMPHSEANAGIDARCHELRVVDEGVTWRNLYRVDPDAIVIAEVFAKKTARPPAARIGRGVGKAI